MKQKGWYREVKIFEDDDSLDENLKEVKSELILRDFEKDRQMDINKRDRKAKPSFELAHKESCNAGGGLVGAIQGFRKWQLDSFHNVVIIVDGERMGQVHFTLKGFKARGINKGGFDFWMRREGHGRSKRRSENEGKYLLKRGDDWLLEKKQRMEAGWRNSGRERLGLGIWRQKKRVASKKANGLCGSWVYLMVDIYRVTDNKENYDMIGFSMWIASAKHVIILDFRFFN